MDYIRPARAQQGKKEFLQLILQEEEKKVVEKMIRLT